MSLYVLLRTGKVKFGVARCADCESARMVNQILSVIADLNLADVFIVKIQILKVIDKLVVLIIYLVFSLIGNEYIYFILNPNPERSAQNNRRRKNNAYDKAKKYNPFDYTSLAAFMFFMRVPFGLVLIYIRFIVINLIFHFITPFYAQRRIIFSLFVVTIIK